MLVKPEPAQKAMWKFATFYGAEVSTDIGRDQGRGLDVGSPASRETAADTAARGGLTAAQSHEVWATRMRLKDRNADGEAMLHGVSIVLKARNTGTKSDWYVYPPGVSSTRTKLSIRSQPKFEAYFGVSVGVAAKAGPVTRSKAGRVVPRVVGP